ncbi:MAG: hypothetical protein L7S63_03475 [Flavobacteriales bacterium]|nr:hypothetical protein [Flavobacteriales bacterium]
MMRRCPILLLLVTALMAGCSTHKGGAMSTADTPGGSAPASDPFTVVSLEVVADSLIAELRYGGGFKDHDFTLTSGGAATKSLPRQQPLRILHDAHGDMGRALITTRQAFDLQPFRDPSQPAIRLSIDGWDTLVDYRYQD